MGEILMQTYSVGFLHDNYRVVLIKKNRPKWQNGLLNGVGGHIEEGESPYKAMVREFYEETGAWVRNWDHCVTLVGQNARIFVYGADDNAKRIDEVKTTTDEEVKIVLLEDLVHMPTVPNLQWLIPLVLQREKYFPVEVNFYGDS